MRRNGIWELEQSLLQALAGGPTRRQLVAISPLGMQLALVFKALQDREGGPFTMANDPGTA